MVKWLIASSLRVNFKSLDTLQHLGFPDGSAVKNPSANAGDSGSIPGLGISPEEKNGNWFQYSCLENPMDGGAWQVTAYGVTRVRHDWATKEQLQQLALMNIKLLN